MVKFDTVGRLKLLATGLGPSAIARKFGCDAQNKARLHQSTASRWLSGESRPEQRHVPELREICGATEDDWLTPKEMADRNQKQVEVDPPARTGTDGDGGR